MTPRKLLAWVALSVLAVVVVAVAGSTGYHRARLAAVATVDTTVRIDGAVHDCGPHRGVYVGISGPVGSRFAVDGVEVPAERREAYGSSPAAAQALLPDPLSAPDCAGAVVHRYEVLPAAPAGCSWTVTSQQSQEEALGHQQALAETGRSCVLTLG